MILKLLVVTGFVTSKKQTTTTSTNQNNTHTWQSFQLMFNSSAEIDCNEPNFNRIMFVISRILAEFCSLRDNSANPNNSRTFSSHPYLFRLHIGGLMLMPFSDLYSYAGIIAVHTRLDRWYRVIPAIAALFTKW